LAHARNSAGAAQAVFGAIRTTTSRRRATAILKYLKILDNTFLFDVVQDPMERANLKERHKDVYDRLVAEWNEWNTAMLPLDPQSFTDGFTGDELPDHFGVKRFIERPPLK
jgi:hypothetical protein